MSYSAPLRDILFTLNELGGLSYLAPMPRYEGIEADIFPTILEEANRFARDVLVPLNPLGDQQGCQWHPNGVAMPRGFANAYAAFVSAGWNNISYDPRFGGQGLPWPLAAALHEIWNSANMAFGLCPILTQAAVELLETHGTAEQQALFLPKLITGAWTGTMNLTEPQAGSDLGQIRMRAIRVGDHYRLIGQKIFISYGDHDLSENIIHVVLARLVNAPPGVKGLSTFLVPKYLVSQDGEILGRNDLRCLSLEHKMGLHASPTAVMGYGENGGAVATLVGEENQGIQTMFTMMNNARLAIALQGLGVAERAYQAAAHYAKTRTQGRAVGIDTPHPAGPVTPSADPIIRHPDVRRNLLVMRSLTDTMRMLIYFAAGALDRAKYHEDEEERTRNKALLDFLTPIVKGFCTEEAVRVASLAIQIHGGAGYIEDTGVAQYLRDVRVTAIYEGTTGIQANDLLGRKLLRDGGELAYTLKDAMQTTAEELAEMAEQVNDASLASISNRLQKSIEDYGRATDWLLAHGPSNPRIAFAGAGPYLMLCGIVLGGWLMGESAQTAARLMQSRPDPANVRFYRSKIDVARFFCENLLALSRYYATILIQGWESTLALPEDQF